MHAFFQYIEKFVKSNSTHGMNLHIKLHPRIAMKIKIKMSELYI